MSMIYEYTEPRIETIGDTIEPNKPIVLSSFRLDYLSESLKVFTHAADQHPSDEDNMKP